MVRELTFLESVILASYSQKASTPIMFFVANFSRNTWTSTLLVALMV